MAYSDNDYATYNTAVQQAIDDRKDAIEASEQGYSAAEASGLATQVTVDATADYSLALAAATAGLTRKTSHNGAEATFRQAESDAYLTITTTGGKKGQV